MSKSKYIDIECDCCHNSFSFKIYHSVNTMLNPELRLKVLTDSIGKFQCPHCGNIGVVRYDMLYHQMEDQFMIFYSSNVDKAIYTFQSINPCFDVDSYQFRVVDSYFDLIEKILIFSDKLDDRIIQLYKTVLEAEFLSNHPNLEYVDIYYSNVNGKQSFIMPETGEELYFNMDFYTILKNAFQEHLDKNNFIVNRAWAYEFMQKHG